MKSKKPSADYRDRERCAEAMRQLGADPVAILRRRDERERKRGWAEAAIQVESYFVEDEVGEERETRDDISSILEHFAGPAAMAWARRQTNKTGGGK